MFLNQKVLDGMGTWISSHLAGCPKNNASDSKKNLNKPWVIPILGNHRETS